MTNATNESNELRKWRAHYENQYIKLNELRALLGLQPLLPKQRKCLKCNKTFMSHSASRRMCKEHTVQDNERHHIFHKQKSK